MSLNNAFSTFIGIVVGLTIGIFIGHYFVKNEEYKEVYSEESPTHKFEKEQIVEKEQIIEDNLIDKEILLKEILKMNIQHPQIVLAQAILESGHFESNMFQKLNNMFGMKIPKQRSTTCLNREESGYAEYLDWQSSLVDYAIWQSCFARNLTEEEYLHFLRAVYAEDENYILKLKELMKDVDK